VKAYVRGERVLWLVGREEEERVFLSEEEAAKRFELSLPVFKQVARHFGWKKEDGFFDWGEIKRSLGL